MCVCVYVPKKFIKQKAAIALTLHVIVFPVNSAIVRSYRAVSDLARPRGSSSNIKYP